MNIDLAGQVAIVTGGSKGIGKGIARRLAEAGTNVMIVSRHLEEAETTSKEIVKDYGVKSLAAKVDVSKISDIKAMVEQTVDKFGRLDILVNNAGVVVRLPALEMTEEAWDTVINTNLKGTFFCSKEAAFQMRKQGKGRIINIGSVHSMIPMKLYTHYGATKAGISQLTKVLAVEWAEYGILVNCVAPGSVPTDNNKEVLAKPENLQRNLDRIYLKRLGTPEEISGMVAFLASDLSSYITGQTIYIDGGWTLY